MIASKLPFSFVEGYSSSIQEAQGLSASRAADESICSLVLPATENTITAARSWQVGRKSLNAALQVMPLAQYVQYPGLALGKFTVLDIGNRPEDRWVEVVQGR